MTKLAICSDLHLEFSDLHLQNAEGAGVLILAGDILVAEHLKGNGDKGKRYRQFIDTVAGQYPTVLAIAGNHEFYGGSLGRTVDALRAEWGRHSNTHFLEGESLVLGDTTYIGGTLWTDCNRGDPVALMAVNNGLNDYRQIRDDGDGWGKLRTQKTWSIHRKTLNTFNDLIVPGNKTVIISHMAPTMSSIDGKYAGDILNYAFASDLSDYILDRPDICLWVHGHTHNPVDYMVGTTRVVCNPRGYVGYERGGQDIDPYMPLILEI